MAGISDTTGQAPARAALVAACKVALAGEDVDIGQGFRWPITSRDWVFATDTDSDIDTATMGPRRSMDETITLTVSIGSWRPGHDDEAELASFTRAFDMLARIQKHIRENDVELGGTVLWCLPGSSTSAGATADSDTEQGRLTEISAQFVCRHRIRT